MPFIFNELTLTMGHHHQHLHHHNLNNNNNANAVKTKHSSLSFTLSTMHIMRATSVHFGLDRKVARGWVRSRERYLDSNILKIYSEFFQYFNTFFR